MGLRLAVPFNWCLKPAPAHCHSVHKRQAKGFLRVLQRSHKPGVNPYKICRIKQKSHLPSGTCPKHRSEQSSGEFVSEPNKNDNDCSCRFRWLFAFSANVAALFSKIRKAPLHSWSFFNAPHGCGVNTRRENSVCRKVNRIFSLDKKLQEVIFYLWILPDPSPPASLLTSSSETML